MHIVYIDSLFLLNFIIDYTLLLITAKISSLEIKRTRLLWAAFLGAVYSVLIYFPSVSMLFGGIFKILITILICIIAFKFGSFGKTLRNSLTLFLCSVALAGIAVFFCHAFGGSVNLRNGVPYIQVSLKILIFSSVICYIILSVIFRGRAKSRTSRQIIGLTVRDGGKSLSLRALVDTGCSLSDPGCGKPIVVCDLCSLFPLFDDRSYKILSEYAKSSPIECMERLSRVTDIRKFRIIPYGTVDGCGIMLTFRPDIIEKRGGSGFSALIGISRAEIPAENGYTALVGAV